MPKSTAFIRIKKAVLDITRSIPAGRVTTFKAIGTHLEVMPRHVAYILATLTDEEKVAVPWYRVVSDSGVLERDRYDVDGTPQSERLAEEGIVLENNRKIQDFDRLFFEVNEATTGVRPVERTGDQR